MNYRVIFNSRKLEALMPVIAITFLFSGIMAAKLSQTLSNYVASGLSSLIGCYKYASPLVIFLVLTYSLSFILKESRGAFAARSILFFLKTRVLACIWAVVFTSLCLRLSFFPQAFNGSFNEFRGSVITMIMSLAQNSFSYAIALAVVVSLLSSKFPLIFKIVSVPTRLIEKFGDILFPLIPVFMFMVGVYIYYLPAEVNNIMMKEGANALDFSKFKVFGMSLAVDSAGGLFGIYIAISMLVGIATLLWHFGFVLFIRKAVSGFSIKHYFSNYWIQMFPFLFATASESLSMPLNLVLVNKHFPDINKMVKDFTVSIGSYIGINGTSICVFVMAAFVAKLVGVELSFVELLMSIPIVIIIGLGVPGIPGELLLFGAPLAAFYNLPPSVSTVFITIFVGLQLGLPDSFRSGVNSTDNSLVCIYLNSEYKEKNI
ncbi:cation:dicarboxylate symporter family transporter [Candidatus Magnetominusculus xianensis]|nr:cation:dicarboxylase symporter family transporter [Candidatus Magnetominusculus xianensis]MBF0404036.1 cation:dicarboxylase symporter family transporter [Nitrospirota bacterium]